VKNWSATLLLGMFLSGCAGYHLGPAKPSYLRDVHTIAVPVFKNTTLIPQIEVLVSDTVIKQFQQDGTYRIANEDRADAVLKADIISAARAPARSLRGNVLATTEFNLVLRVRYTLVGKDGRPLAGPAEAAGTTSFFVGSDVVADERQALPLAAEEMANHLVSQLSEGW
jgi:hypothetical protein